MEINTLLTGIVIGVLSVFVIGKLRKNKKALIKVLVGALGGYVLGRLFTSYVASTIPNFTFGTAVALIPIAVVMTIMGGLLGYYYKK